MIVRAGSRLPLRSTANTGNVALRVPGAVIPRAIVEELGLPITATSANLQGLPGCNYAACVRDQIGNRIPLIVDGGPTGRSVATTIVDLSTDGPWRFFGKEPSRPTRLRSPCNADRSPMGPKMRTDCCPPDLAFRRQEWKGRRVLRMLAARRSLPPFWDGLSGYTGRFIFTPLMTRRVPPTQSPSLAQRNTMAALAGVARPLDQRSCFYREHLAPLVITLGGGGDPRDSEGGVGHDYLLAHGVPENQIIAETQSTTQKNPPRAWLPLPGRIT